MKALEPHLPAHKTHFIFDWNGTLIDDVDLHVQLMTELMSEHRLPVMDRERYRSVFRMPILEYYRELGFDLQTHAFETIAMEFIRRYRERVHGCRLFEGTRELLERLKAEGKRCAILSAAQETELKELLRHFGIADFFEKVCGLSDHYAASKMERGLELMSHWKTDPARCLLIGDMDHDLEVGHRLGVDVLLVGDGHQSYERLKAIHSHVVESRAVVVPAS